jgi:hypothetical protein
VTGLVLVLALATAPAAGPRVYTFSCELGDGRTHLLSRARENESEDELRCRAVIIGLPPGDAELAGELRLRAPGGRLRVVASSTFERDGTEATIQELLVPHATFAPAIWWRPPTRPRLLLELHVFTRHPRQRRWRTLVVRPLVIDHHPRRRAR